MKKCILFAAIGLLLASCTKKTDNYYTNPKPAFTISGIQDVRMQANTMPYAELNLTVEYMDSTQGRVSLSVSGLPAGITMDTAISLSGIPSFSTTLFFLDTSITAPAAAGTYPITLTAYSSTSAQKTYTFNMIIMPVPNITADVVGVYAHCNTGCSNANYTDSVYADASVINKIYFHNFMNTGQTVYANLTPDGVQTQQYTITIPQQTVNGYSFSASSGGYYSNQIILNDVQYTQNGVTESCYGLMNR